MIKSGHAVDDICDQLLPLLSKGDIIMDGGNSHYKDTQRRSDAMALEGIHFVGSGISGGEYGARHSPSFMPGGSTESYEALGTLLETISAKNFLKKPCCYHIGPDGSGHFIKMVHNGIEYAEMQLLAEIYAILSIQLNKNEISELLKEWNKTELENYLLEITSKIISHKDGDEYLLDKILDKAGNKGTGSWSSQSAMELGTVNTMMSSAVFARYITALKSQRVQLSKKIKSINRINEIIDLEAIKKAYGAARLINHHQGFELIRQASEQYNWNLNLSKIASIWTNGCIIRSALMRQCINYLKADSQLIQSSDIISELINNEYNLSQLIKYGIDNRIAMPTINAAYQYWIALTTATLPANLIQAQRDYFGAHTYQRVDDIGGNYYHTQWDKMH